MVGALEATAFTTCVMALLVAGALLASPAYSAVMLWLPTARLFVLQEAVALALAMVAVHKVVFPSLKSTLPVGDTAEAKVAVSVTETPKLAGLALLLSPSAGSALVSNNRRDCVGAATVLPFAPSSPAAREARTPHRLPDVALAFGAKVLPLTVQVSGVQTS